MAVFATGFQTCRSVYSRILPPLGGPSVAPVWKLLVFNCAQDPGCIEAAKLAIELPDGGGVWTLFTFTVTFAAVVLLPAASLAIALKVCEPLLTVVVFQEKEYGEAVSRLPKFAPSSRNCTLATPTLSEAVAVTDTVLEIVAPFAGAVMDTVGGVVSGVVLFTVMLTAALVVEFPAASVATAVRAWLPFDKLAVFSEYE